MEYDCPLHNNKTARLNPENALTANLIALHDAVIKAYRISLAGEKMSQNTIIWDMVKNQVNNTDNLIKFGEL